MLDARMTRTTMHALFIGFLERSVVARGLWQSVRARAREVARVRRTFGDGNHFYDKAVIRQLNRLSEKRRSFKRGLWGSCVATLMPHKAILLSRRDAAPPASFQINVAKDRF